MGMRNVLAVGWWFFGGIVLAGLILRWWIGDELFLARYVGYLLPWLLLGLLPGVLWAVFMHQRGLAIVLGVSATLILYTYAPLFLPRPAAPSSSALELKVISFNTWSKNPHAGRIAEVVLAQKPDLLLLQEIEPEVFERLMAQLQNLYVGQKAHFSYESKLLQAVVSRFPVETAVRMKNKGQVQRVVILSPAGRIVVFNVHPLRRGGWFSRYRQMASLLEGNVINETGPVILGGDFNITDQSQSYKMISSHMRNAHREAGFGFGFSYPSSSVQLFGLISPPALVRIDHIFFSEHFSARQAGTLKDSGGSDHFPVLAVLDLKLVKGQAG